MCARGGHLVEMAASMDGGTYVSATFTPALGERPQVTRSHAHALDRRGRPIQVRLHHPRLHRVLDACVSSLACISDVSSGAADTMVEEGLCGRCPKKSVSPCKGIGGVKHHGLHWAASLQ